MAASGSSASRTFRIKWQIPDSSLPSVATIQQGYAGPCPILALANTLLLRRSITIPQSTSIISEEELLGLVASHESAAEYFDVLPHLSKEVAVDPRFCGTTEFSASKELDVFRAFRIRVVHGAIPDPQDERVGCILPLSYNEVCDELVHTLESFPSKDASNPRAEAATTVAGDSLAADVGGLSEGKRGDDFNGEQALSSYHLDELSDAHWEGPRHLRNLEQGALGAASFKSHEPEAVSPVRQNAMYVQAFLDDHQSMLTHHGLDMLRETLAEGEFAVQFYNNHFNVICKHNRLLFILATDVGFFDEPSIMWESLNDVDGDTSFYDASFRPAVMLVSSHSSPEATCRSASRSNANEEGVPRRAPRVSNSTARSRREQKSKNRSSTRRPSSGCVIA